MAASTPFARSYFRQAWANAQSEGVTLLAKLNALNASAVEATATGQVIQATSGNGRSVTFSEGQGATPNDIVELLDRLLNLYDAAVADGANTDALRYSWILDALQPVRVIRSNFALQIHR